MIVLDTNVVSELMRASPEPSVLAWVDQQQTDRTFLTAITTAELFYGVTRLPDGERKRDLEELVDATVDGDFGDRVIAFDHSAARHYAEIVVERERAGRPIAMADAQIAAISRSRSATIATRNVADFSGTGVSIVNPWKPAESKDDG